VRSLSQVFAGLSLYKKIDSTLRGPWVEEVEELLELTGYAQAVVCPAFPSQGRTVRGGWLWLHGERVARIECPFEVRDASTEEELAQVAAGICEAVLPVGSAGLARHVFAGLGGTAPPLPRPGTGEWLVLVGSDHPVSQEQMRAARAAGVTVNPEVAPDPPAAVFATGGETAAQFLRRSGAQGIASLRELLPGIPAGVILGGRYNGLLMVAKAGGFGATDTIVRAIGLCSRASESR